VRVTTASTYLTTSRGLGGALERVADVQGKLASGKSVTKWSDDAPAATAAERYRAQEADWSSFSRSVTDAKGWLATTDGYLQSMSSLLIKARELAVSATNGGLSADSRKAAADQLGQLRTELRDLGNASHLGRPLFAGLSDRTLADDGTTISFVGDDEQIRRQVSPTVALEINVNGRTLFGFDSDSDVFSTLERLSQAARDADPVALAEGQEALSAHHAAVLRGLSQVGATTNRVEASESAGSVALVDLAARRSELEDIDVADAVLRLNAAQAGYQAALGAAGRANLPSLVDFLR
jgi:flagellar hook-associated protein 3 FlgL